MNCRKIKYASSTGISLNIDLKKINMVPPVNIALTFLFLVLSTFASATDYYISASGNDTNSGLSPETAWQTISKVNSSTFQPGDQILFKRGDMWREQIKPSVGSADNYLYYGAYGTGAKPLFLGSKQENKTSDWIDQGGNIWQNSDSSFTADIGNIIFDNEESCGVKIMSATPKLDAQGKFWYDFVNHRLMMYSVGNPASFYTNIECVLHKNALIEVDYMQPPDYTHGAQYVTFQNLDFRYWNFVWCNGGNYMNFYDLSISFIGGCDQLGNYTTRYGNGLQIYENVHDINIQRCRIDNVYDAGISPQGFADEFEFYNIYINKNILSNCEYSFEFFAQNLTASAHDIYFENNTCINAGGGWGHNQRPDGPRGCHLLISYFIGSKNNIYIKNNILYNATEALSRMIRPNDDDDMILDYNNYYQPTGGGVIGFVQDNNISYTTLSDWKTAINQEPHAIGTNPNFVSSTNFHLQSNSPCINAGVDVGLTEDYEGNPIVGVPDIGAYEFYSIPIPLFQYSEIENTAPSLIGMTYNLSLANIVPATSAFTVLVNSAARAVKAVTILGTKVQLTLASAIAFGDVVTVAYAKPAVNPVQTSSAGQAESVTAQAVTNNVNPVSLLVMSAAIENATPSLLQITYNMSLANVGPSVNAFSVKVNSVVRKVKSVTIAGNMVLLTLAKAIVYGDVVTVAYTKPSLNPLQTTSLVLASSFTTKPVTNNCLKMALKDITLNLGLTNDTVIYSETAGNFKPLVTPDLEKSKITIYPNPAHAFFNISFDEPTVEPQILKIIDLSGKIVLTDLIEQGIQNIQIPVNFKSGNYIIALESNGKVFFTQKLIILQ